MTESLRALLNRAIDYAGMFPPARLPLEGALDAYVGYRKTPWSWMLSKFVLPASRLADLPPLLRGVLQRGDRVTLSVIGSGGELESWRPSLEEDVARIGALLAGERQRVTVNTFETKLPPESADDSPATPEAFLTPLLESFRGAGLSPHVFVEPPPGAAPGPIVAALADLATSSGLRLGFKLRAGGLSAEAIPGVEQVAEVVVACRDAGLRWKATAGLHHPLRHYDQQFGADAHGFLNLFTAAVLARVHRLDAGQVGEILADGLRGSFRFDDDGLRWRDKHASVPQITESRQTSLVSFGSCSFDEPRQDLQALDLL